MAGAGLRHSLLLKEGRGKGLRADLPGNFGYLWRAGNGKLLAQNYLFLRQHALHAMKQTGWIYMVLAENERTDLFGGYLDK